MWCYVFCLDMRVCFFGTIVKQIVVFLFHAYKKKRPPGMGVGGGGSMVYAIQIPGHPR